MSIAVILDLVDQIDSLCPALPKSVLKGSKEDRIPYVLNNVQGLDTGDDAKASTFIRRMDLLFGTGVRDENGRMIHIRRGPWGVPLVIQYFRKIDWQPDGISLVAATLKFTQLLDEMKFLCNGPDHHNSSAIPEAPAVEPAAVSSPYLEPPDASSPPSPKGSKRGASAAVSDNEDYMPPRKIRTTRNGTVSVEDSEDSDDEDEDMPSPTSSKCWVSDVLLESKNDTVIISDDESDDGISSTKAGGKKGKKPNRVTKEADRRRAKRAKTRIPASDPTVLGEDNMLADINVPPLVDPGEAKLDPTADIKQFFGAPFQTKGKRGPELKAHRKCKICGDVIIADASTNRRHMAKHAVCIVPTTLAPVDSMAETCRIFIGHGPRK
ncbi:hypothetical protein B0H11DRAFT_2427266 [Mycena galericulata]|nr:hypothetical protein B0H11DRAFT_2427266 [Mycena galericulata]